MGVQVSFPNVQEGNLIFPFEVLEQIIQHLSIRDRLIARQVCSEWQEFIDSCHKTFVDKVVVRVEHSEEPVKFLDQSTLGMRWGSFSFKSVEFTRHSLSFWENYGDQLTWIDFYDCTFPQNAVGSDGEKQQYCSNLKHLGVRNCDKYLMMGKVYFRLDKFFDLRNLEVLDLSENKYLNDYTLLTLAVASKCLRSINLKQTNMSFTQAVFNRFYPRDKIFNNYAFRGEDAQDAPGVIFRDFSDNILTFHMLYFAFLSTGLACHMEELIFDETRVDMKALRLLMDPEQYSWKSLSLNKCMEIKHSDFVEFISSQRNLEKVELGCSKVNPSQLGVALQYLTNLQHLVMPGCTEARKTDFLQGLSELRVLDISSCAYLEFNPEDFAHLHKLQVLRMRGTTPFYAMNFNNAEKAAILCSIIGTLPNLTELDLGDSGAALTDSVMQKIITSLPSLQVLNVCQCNITDRGLAGTELQDVDSRPKIRSDIVESSDSSPPGYPLSRLKYLRTLNLSKCRALGEASWRLALQLPNLQHLDLSSCWQITVTGFSSIITQCPNLETLNIVQCGLHITGNQELLDLARRHLTRLRQLIV